MRILLFEGLFDIDDQEQSEILDREVGLNRLVGSINNQVSSKMRVSASIAEEELTVVILPSVQYIIEGESLRALIEVITENKIRRVVFRTEAGSANTRVSLVGPELAKLPRGTQIVAESLTLGPGIGKRIVLAPLELDAMAIKVSLVDGFKPEAARVGGHIYSFWDLWIDSDDDVISSETMRWIADINPERISISYKDRKGEVWDRLRGGSGFFTSEEIAKMAGISAIPKRTTTVQCISFARAQAGQRYTTYYYTRNSARSKKWIET